MKTITLEKAFQTNEYSETPSYIKLTFTPEEIAKIQKHQEYVKENDDVIVCLDFMAELFEDEEMQEESEFRVGHSHLKIYYDQMYYYAQSKWDSTDQFESEGFTIEQLEETTA